MELLAGSNERNAQTIERIISGMRPLVFDHREDFAGAARLSVIARSRGLSVRSLVDCLIAYISLRHDDVIIAHCDGDFDRLTRATGLATERWDSAA